jgi:hypothetical protein
MKYIKVFLKKEELKGLSKEELTQFLQMLRIINSLRLWTRLQLQLREDEEKMFTVASRIELYFVSIAKYEEAVKVFLRSIEPKLNRRYLSADINTGIERLKNRVGNRKNDDFFKLVEILRDKIAFHFDEDIIKERITDGEPQEDLLVAVATGDQIKDCLYVEPYTFLFAHLTDNAPDHVPRKDVLDWLQRTSIEESDSFCGLIERICSRIVREIGYKRADDSLT